MKKTNRIIYLAITLITGIVLSFIFSTAQFTEKEYDVALPDGDWYITNCQFDRMNADVDDDVLKITYYNRKASGNITLGNDDGEELHYAVQTVDGELIVTEE